MFTLEDDIDEDEDFLSNVFDTTTNQNYTHKVFENASDNRSQFISKPLQDLRNLDTDNKEKHRHVQKNNAEFLEQWKSSENNLINIANSTKKSDPRSKIDVSRAVSPRGFKTEVFTRVTKNVRPRKFPGPAGLLPERNSNTSFIVPDEFISNLEKDSENFSEVEEQEIFSQNTSKLFEEPEGPWQKMIYDLGKLGKHLISTINLSTLQGKQTRNGFKVPFLAVFVQSVDCSLPDPSVLLKDEKEEINGTLHRDVWEEWKEDIVIGSVLVLRNVGVISAGNSSRRYFLNITSNNLIAIYSPTKDSSIKMIKMNSLSNMDTSVILNEWEKLMKQNKPPPSVASENEHPRTLFNMFSPGLPPNSPALCKPSPIRPQFSNSAKGRPSPLPLGRGNAAVRNSNGYRFNQSPNYSRFSPQTSSKASFPSSSACQRLTKEVDTPSPLSKRLRTVEPSPKQHHNKTLENIAQPPIKNSIFSIPDLSSSIVESVLDGIDTDSLFEDF